MEAYLISKKRKLEPSEHIAVDNNLEQPLASPIEDESTDIKVAILASLYPETDYETLLDLLIFAQGSVEIASANIVSTSSAGSFISKQMGQRSISYQSSLSAFALQPSGTSKSIETASTQLTRKGQTLHLYTPEDIAAHTPCSIIHRFLSPEIANGLLEELLQEVPTFQRQTFKLFDNVVTSSHSACFYVNSLEDLQKQSTEYLYNGSYLKDIRRITPQMRAVSSMIEEAVNLEIANRIKTHYPNGTKLKYQSPNRWEPNAAFVNCYAGGAESVGYHSDQLTYLGPRAVIGSLSLGVAREFRVRKIVARVQDDNEEPNPTGADEYCSKRKKASKERADAEGQIAIHLPHNSLLIMHAEMQEEWKHSIHPAAAIDPHPIAGNRRINVTYRYYRDEFHPKYVRFF